MLQLIYVPDDIRVLRDSIAAFGFGCLPGAIEPAVLQDLRDEAQERFASSLAAEQSTELNYRARIVSLGPRARGLLAGEPAIDLLGRVFGEKFALVDQSSCLTFYREGDHLGAHRDEPESQCTITVIVYLVTRAALPRSNRTGLVLRVYGDEMTADGEPALTIPTQAGAIVVGRGSKVWHERPKLQAGESLDALTACYRRAS